MAEFEAVLQSSTDAEEHKVNLWIPFPLHYRK
jgi:hypothetical protein